MRRIFTIMHKEILHIIRDLRTLIMALILPVVMLLLYGYALTFDVKHIPTVLWNKDQSILSRDFVSDFKNSQYFDINFEVFSDEKIKELIEKGLVKVALVIPSDFSKKSLSGSTAQVQIILDGTDSNSAAIASSYIQSIVYDFVSRIGEKSLKSKGISMRNLSPINIVPRIWYNPELKSINFLVPGIMCTILLILSVLLTSMTIVGEKERGTIEQLVTSPIKPYEIITGKLLPYGLIALFDVAMVTAVGSFWFRVPIKGSLLLLMLLSMLFIIGALGIGLLISTIARTQQEAMLMAMLTSMLPSILLSGFIFPISSMPKIVQFLSYFIPARYFIVMLRGIFLKGIGINYLCYDAIFLTIFAILVLTISSLRFKKRLE